MSRAFRTTLNRSERSNYRTNAATIITVTSKVPSIARVYLAITTGADFSLIGSENSLFLFENSLL